MSCEDIPSLLDLQKVKKHADDFGRLMGIGEGDSTNEVTGQVRPTYNKVIGGMNNEFNTMIGGMNNEFDAQILNMGFTRIGTFASGATITNPRQTLLWDVADGGDGQEYGWSGSFQKVVPAASTPSSTGGISVGAWISRFDPELRIQVREALCRSYAESGYNLVDGSFEAGGTLVNANDVLLQESTGKAFSGSAGPVAAGTDPTSGGFVDRSGDLLRDVIFSSMSVASKAELQAITTTLSGLFIRVFSTTGADHIRVLSSTDDGTGVLTAGGMYANVHITKPRTIYMSQLFVEGGSDQSDLIFNKLPAKITAAGITNVVLDTGDISIFGGTTLPEVYNKVTFSGIGKLLTKSRDNILQRMSSEKTDSKKYHGQYNLGAVYNAVSKARIMKAKEFRVVLFGDSISVGSDYDSFGSIPPGARAMTGVDNAERNNCLAATIFNELCSIMPAGVRVKFYSRSIGGLAYGNIDQAWDTLGALWEGREGVVSGRSWRDCVLSLNPDLVIHSMGMNESPTTYLDNFKTKWADYIASSAVQKSVTFDQAVLTTPNPNFIDGAPYGDFKKYGLNASKFFVATMQRYVARRYNYSLIDVAFNSYLKRYGFDCRSVNFSATYQRYVFPDGASSHVCAPGEAPSLSLVTPTDLPFYWSTRFTLNSATASNTPGYSFVFNAGSINVQFAGGKIDLYSGIFSGAGVFVRSAAYTLPAATDVSVRVTVTPTSIYLYIDDVLTIAANDVPFTDTLPMQFNNYGGNAAVTVKSGATYSQQFARYGQDAVTHGDYYGELLYPNNPNGGSVNHPSSTMLAEIYLPPVREFLTALLSASVEYDTVVGGTAAGQMVYIGRIFGKQHNKVSIKERGSTRETIIRMTSSSTWIVEKNTGGAVSVYIDPVDLAVFIYNPSDTVLQIEYTGDWIVKRVEKLGITTPRGTLLATVP